MDDETYDHSQSSIVNGQWSELWEMPASEHPFPLPNNSRTEPHLAVKPHVAMGNDLEKKISNYEEIRPKTKRVRCRWWRLRFWFKWQLAHFGRRSG